MTPGLLNYFRAEEYRLARLKIFCAAHSLVFKEWREKIAEICNNYLLNPEEVQRRFMYCKNSNIDIPLEHPIFWDWAEWEIIKRNK